MNQRNGDADYRTLLAEPMAGFGGVRMGAALLALERRLFDLYGTSENADL